MRSAWRWRARRRRLGLQDRLHRLRSPGMSRLPTVAMALTRTQPPSTTDPRRNLLAHRRAVPTLENGHGLKSRLKRRHRQVQRLNTHYQSKRTAMQFLDSPQALGRITPSTHMCRRRGLAHMHISNPWHRTPSRLRVFLGLFMRRRSPIPCHIHPRSNITHIMDIFLQCTSRRPHPCVSRIHIHHSHHFNIYSTHRTLEKPFLALNRRMACFLGRHTERHHGCSWSQDLG